MTDPNPTLADTMSEFDAGRFPEKALMSLKEVVLGVLATGNKGKLTLSLELNQIGDTSGVQIKHGIKYESQTLNGKATEDSITTTVMYADGKGNLSVFPQAQNDLFKSAVTYSGE